MKKTLIFLTLVFFVGCKNPFSAPEIDPSKRDKQIIKEIDVSGKFYNDEEIKKIEEQKKFK